MRELILLKSGEIALKGLNRYTFEDKLIQNCKRKLADLGTFHFYKAQSTLYAEPVSEGVDLDEAVRRLQKVFGFAALSRACVVDKDFDAIVGRRQNIWRRLWRGSKPLRWRPSAPTRAFL